MTCPTHHTILRAKRFEAGGQSLTMREWARLAGVSPCTFRKRVDKRLRDGWTVEDAILTPPQRPGNKSRALKFPKLNVELR